MRKCVDMQHFIKRQTLEISILGCQPTTATLTLNPAVTNVVHQRWF